ncbi:carbohydrate ABC transporter permease [Agromyces mediolanus]|uniref:carbohydrate ABC transporter permease n=1 Tax=Agromyces mediolanus TaxID=41986 RepID=UPI0020415398|nr:carbohydrate ABC transporter permease [Agromyces mediolanus]MCM3657169.1 carbohydrate ABC transporter permease [Agromyces mediolanus]
MSPQNTARAPRRAFQRATRSTPGRLFGWLPRLVIWLFVGFNLVVLAITLLSSVKTTKDIFAAPLGLPTTWEWGNWSTAWSNSGFAVGAINSLIVVGSASIAVVAIAAPAAYALSRMNVRWAKQLSTAFVLGIGIPPHIIIIPLFIEFSQLGLINSKLGLIIVYTGVSLPFAVFLLTGFMAAVPKEIEEAASLDGAGPIATLVRIFLPTVRNGLLTVFIITAVSLWNEVLIALTFVQSNDNFTLGFSLMSLLSAIQYSGADYGLLFAGVGIMLVPMLLLFVLLRRFVIEGMTLGVGK